MNLPFTNQLRDSQRIFLCGAGGGYDIFSGIPLYFLLKEMGKDVILGNYSFSMLPFAGGEKIGPTGFIITPDARELGYFPEKFLVEWLAKQEVNPICIGFEKTGVIPLHQSMKAVTDRYQIDTMILVDGGTDSLMTGDEAGLGTPAEDVTSIAAANRLKLDRKFLVSLGFGVDHFHGVSHYQFLENVAEQVRCGGYLGCFSVTDQDRGGQEFLSLVEYANRRYEEYPSIVANSIGSAIKGNFGNYHATHRTRGSKLFINPLMSIYWTFKLKSIADKILYLSMIEDTFTIQDVVKNIVMFRDTIKHKDWENIPL